MTPQQRTLVVASEQLVAAAGHVTRARDLLAGAGVHRDVVQHLSASGASLLQAARLVDLEVRSEVPR